VIAHHAKMSAFIVADTEYGSVKGVRKISCLGTCFDAFLGIPYAKPPVGELRFKVGAAVVIKHANRH
jgi:carboxylesterase type B